MNKALCKNFTTDEVFNALSQMHPSKSPGHGMPSNFFQSNQHVIGDSVTTAVLDALHSGDLPSNLNHTFFILNPKKETPLKVSDYHPISLCDVIYKIISKVITNRLRVILPHIILESQSAFFLDMQIIGCVLVAYEIVHYLRHKRGGRKGFMSFKFDMTKDYDRVEWNYLERVLAQMGFRVSFIHLIMMCV